MRRTILVSVLLLALMPLPDARAAVNVEMQDNEFTPRNAHVDVHDPESARRVRWENTGNVDHHTYRDASLYDWDSGTIGPGQTFPKLFKFAGAYDYYCVFHSGMTGWVRVKPWVGLDGDTTINVGETARVRVGSESAPDGLVFDIQRKVDGVWTKWRYGVTARSKPFTPSSDGRRYFRARLRKLRNGTDFVTDWSPAAVLVVT